PRSNPAWSPMATPPANPETARANRGGGSCAPPLLVPRHGVLALHGGTAAGPAGGAAAARRGLGTSARLPGGLVRPGGHIVQRLAKGLQAVLDGLGVVAAHDRLQPLLGLLDVFLLLGRHLVAQILQGAVDGVNQAVGLVLELGQLLAAPVLLRVLLGLPDHALDVLGGQTR